MASSTTTFHNVALSGDSDRRLTCAVGDYRQTASNFVTLELHIGDSEINFYLDANDIESAKKIAKAINGKKGA